MSLGKVYRAFDDAIYHQNQSSLAHLIYDSSSFSKDERIHVYVNNTLGSLIDTLKKIYPVCSAVLGEDYFGLVAKDYVRHHSSSSVNLDDYGEYLPQHLYLLSQQREELAPYSFLPDLARLEWFYNSAYHAPRRLMFDFEKFAALSEAQQAQSVLTLASDLNGFESKYPVHKIWDAHQTSNSHDLIDHKKQKESAIDREKGNWFFDDEASFILVDRPELKPVITSVDHLCYEVWLGIQQGMSIEQLSARFPDGVAHIPDWLQCGWIVGFSVRGACAR